ncbi:hypothetical protein K5M76_06675 [Shewanella xiamenensis]|uniref:hypothetical protein n=1 Tax=Shewanella xiamenensis TaxID=332186 RepID=UPI00217E27D7|nr:hypothetical protein [Shewanella xiamenensis]MCT8858361.1 hypothetical protein [Shewanella xiamenensis]UWG65906.1 hypothetical protein K5M76_06675 [Shewanella xiamenensis]
MEQLIKKVVLRIFPELSAGLHLPRWGKVVALPELPAQDGERRSDAFYPRYAADVQLLDENGNATKSKPLQAVPLPLNGAGNKAGRLEPPAIGSIVEIGFAYGRPDKPFIRTILPFGWDLPAIKAGESRTQTREGVYQHIDEDGNFYSVTDKDSTIECLNQRIKVLEDQLTEVLGQMTMNITKDLRITAKNITEDADTIKLNGGSAVVTCAHICHFTGAPHGDGSSTVSAGK